MSAAATGETQTVGMRGLECLEGYPVPGLLGLTAATGTRAPDDRQTLEHDGPALVEVLVHRRKGP